MGENGDGRKRVAVVVADGLGSHHHVVGEARGERASKDEDEGPLSSLCDMDVDVGHLGWGQCERT